MTRPRLLDLFCCEGGAGMGYHRAGFDVVGVDIAPQPRYPFPFVQADALDYVREHGQEFDAIHASPPCQAYSTMTADPTRHPDLIGPTREALRATGRPYVIENVVGARSQLRDPLTLCGSSFGLAVRRHRLFESSVPLLALPCAHGLQTQPVGVYGDHPDRKAHTRPDGSSRGVKARTDAEAAEALGVDWMTWHGMRECIPPAFTEWLGAQLLEALEVVRA